MPWAISEAYAHRVYALIVAALLAIWSVAATFIWAKIEEDKILSYEDFLERWWDDGVLGSGRLISMAVGAIIFVPLALLWLAVERLIERLPNRERAARAEMEERVKHHKETGEWLP